MSKIAGRKWLLIVIILVVLGVSVGVVIWMFSGGTLPEPFPQNMPPPSLAPATPTLTGQPSSAGMKTYTNTEFSFEFQYPKEWTLRPDVFYSRHSFFNLAGVPPKKETMLYAPLPPFFVSIVTPDFAERLFYILKNTASETKVGGVMGLRYKYETEWVSSVIIVLPLGEYRMILGTTKDYKENYEDVFNQILASFRFLKSTIQMPSVPEVKTYRNEEWGFEFEYPKEVWIFRTNTFSSPNSKFHLIGAPLDKEGLIYAPNPPFVLNVVTPDFAERSFYDLKNTASETKVGGIAGFKYEYDYEGQPEIAIILPVGQYKMILGANKGYEDIFNQILASFKFLK